MYPYLRPWLFRLEPERAHALTLGLLRLAGVLAPARGLLRAMYAVPPQPLQVFGLEFPNRIGLAAGYDKDAWGWRGLACLGFGHIEIGTVTLQPQTGNPQPRLFRLPEDRALINRMGFPSQGAEAVAQRLEQARLPGLVLGVNLGKNKDTPLEAAAEEYAALVRIFAPLADYLAINVSSPNTLGLRRLQGRDLLEDLLAGVMTERRAQVDRLGRVRQASSLAPPVLVKLAPDLADDELDDAIAALLETGVDGVIATNTTTRRENLLSPSAGEVGGLSGAPLASLATGVIQRIYQRAEGRLPIIGVGGIMTPDDGRLRLEAGATLIQVYTGLVYQGPGLVKALLKGL